MSTLNSFSRNLNLFGNPKLINPISQSKNFLLCFHSYSLPTRSISLKYPIRSYSAALDPSSSFTPSSSPSSSSDNRNANISLPSPPTSLRLRIQSPSSKARTYKEWTPEIDDQLVDLRSQGRTWAEIGSILDRSRQACNRRYDAILSPTSGSAFWEDNPEKQEILIALRSQNWSWTDIANQLGTKASSCEKRWRLIEQDREKQEQRQRNSSKAETEKETEEKKNPLNILRFKQRHLPTLLQAIEEYGTDQWETISENVFDSRISPQYLRHQYLSLETKRKKWTSIQNTELEKAVQEFCFRQDKEPIIKIDHQQQQHMSPGDELVEESHWKDIANFVSGNHTSSECRERWIKLQLFEKGRRKAAPMTKSPGTYSGTLKKTIRWTPEQSQRMERFVHELQTQPEWRQQGWDLVAKKMNYEFTSVQCKTRWNRKLIDINRYSTGSWSRSEIEQLIRGINEFGYNWTLIKENWVPGRTRTLCQGKWMGIKTKMHLEMETRRRSWKQVCIDNYGEEIGHIMSRLDEIWPNICKLPSK